MSVDAGLDVAEAADSIFIDGALYSAPAGSTRPTSATAALPAQYVGHGFWSSEGVTQSSSKSTNSVRAFQQNQLVAETVTEGTGTTSLVLLQGNAANASLFYGAEVNTTTGAVTWNPGRANGRREFVLDKVNQEGEKERIVGEGEVTEMADRVTTYGAVTGYGVTITWYGEPTVYNTGWIAGGGGV